MLAGERVRLRPFRDKELDLLETWIEHREQGIGAHQPYVLGQGAMLRKVLSDKLEPAEQSGFLAIEMIDGGHCIGFVRYSLQPMAQSSIEFYGEKWRESH